MRIQKRLLRGLAACLMLLSCCSAVYPVSAESESETPAAEDADTEWKKRTEAEVLSNMRLAAENDRLAFYVWDEEKTDSENGVPQEDRFALVNKKTGYIWWSSPVNAEGDDSATPVLRKELASAMVLTEAKINERSTADHRSGDVLKTVISVSDIKNGVRVTYFFRKAGIKIPVSYVLLDDCLEVRIDTSEITEKNGPDSETPRLAQALSVMNAFGAADSTETGYFVIPDGSGAVIGFNSQKPGSKPYRQMIYGDDITAVPKTKGIVTKGVSLPMFGICKGENAMLAVAAEGDGSCQLCADVSGAGQSNTAYNRCFFRFLLRSADQYYLGGDQLTPLDVYEKTLSDRTIRVRYYPLTPSDDINADGGKELDFTDIAARYRQYLQEDLHVQTAAKPNDAPLFVSLYGGCMKQRNLLGFPVSMKTAMTTYAEMQQILENLRAAGAEQLTVSLNRWTDAGISGKVDYKAKASHTLGGSGAFRQLTDYLDSTGTAWYPVVTNAAFRSGNGYWALTDTAVRVSGSFARIVDYERAFGLPDNTRKARSLLSPDAFPALYRKLADSCSAASLHSISIGGMSTALYGDYGKKSAASRDTAKQYLTDSLQLLNQNVGGVLSADPNAYVLPYTETVSSLPLCSSGFSIFDGDIPLYQLVLHGVLPYASGAVNGSADPEQSVLRAVAAGSNLQFDLLAADTDRLRDTDFDVFYYATADYWTQSAAQYYRFAKDILAPVSDSYIISYTDAGSVITTEYANGIETVTDLQACSVTVNGRTYSLNDYTEKGAVIPE